MPTESTRIRFGTDGWRAVIADGFTFENLSRVAAATASWVTNTYGAGSTIVVGYDTRFLGERFARRAAEVMADAGHDIVLSTCFLPTPAVSWATKEYGAQAGVVITASHNPPEYNGFKIKGHFGGSALPEMVAAVEALVPADPVGPAKESGRNRIEERDIRAEYVDMLRRRIDVEAITSSGIRVVHDAMYGAGQGVLSEVLGGDHVVELRSSRNPGFDGVPPEPIEKNLAGVGHVIRERSCDAAIANDGDADRIGMFDEKGRFVDSHRLLSLLVDYLARDRELGGRIVKTVSTTDMLDRMADELGLPIDTTPIGFKYIGERILSEDVLVGGEESGGMAVKGHIPERDGLFIGLLILEMMARRGRRLSFLVRDLHERYGEFGYVRSDVHLDPAEKDE
ncbi:MAG: phosphoglucomutase/phosphomannomutase family protein, partial [Rhodothermales bacterium]|nr:phosphoglucomutase/phosphomannomutase family protein [Rhodothermales bacterium]